MARAAIDQRRQLRLFQLDRRDFDAMQDKYPVLKSRLAQIGKSCVKQASSPVADEGDGAAASSVLKQNGQDCQSEHSHGNIGGAILGDATPPANVDVQTPVSSAWQIGLAAVGAALSVLLLLAAARRFYTRRA